MMDEKKYEAHAYLKYKEDENKTLSDDEKQLMKNASKKLLESLGKLLFEATLTDLYNEGMSSGTSSSAFMIRLTDFFVTQTVSFYMPGRSKEEIIREMNLFLDAVKQDSIIILEHALNTKDKFKL